MRVAFGRLLACGHQVETICAAIHNQRNILIGECFLFIPGNRESREHASRCMNNYFALNNTLAYFKIIAVILFDSFLRNMKRKT